MTRSVVQTLEQQRLRRELAHWQRLRPGSVFAVQDLDALPLEALQGLLRQVGEHFDEAPPQPPAAKFPSDMAIHGVRLEAFTPGAQGAIGALRVNYAGKVVDLPCSQCDGQPGSTGYLHFATPDGAQGQRDGSWAYVPYLDQSLRRAPELDRTLSVDDSARMPAVLGWRCAGRPDGFEVPAGVIPGVGGEFERDRTEPLTVDVPPEFEALCREEFGQSSLRVLRQFMADAAALSNPVEHPRADRFTCGIGTNQAFAYLELAWEEYRERAQRFQDLKARQLERANEIEEKESRILELFENAIHGNEDINQVVADLEGWIAARSTRAGP